MGGCSPSSPRQCWGALSPPVPTSALLSTSATHASVKEAIFLFRACRGGRAAREVSCRLLGSQGPASLTVPRCTASARHVGRDIGGA